MTKLIYVILIVVFLLLLRTISKYNKVIRFLNRVKKAKANIEIYLNKRFDLIPNLIECVKGYSKHENETLKDITSLRNKYSESKNITIKDAERMNNELTKYLITIESYPELKANENFLSLQGELRNIEDELSYARNVYNNEVTRYNTYIEKIPNNIVASIFGFKRIRWFQIEDEKRENVKVEV